MADIKNIKTGILEDKIIVDGKEHPFWMLLNARRGEGEPWTLSLSSSKKDFSSAIGNDKLYKFSKIRFPDKIDGEWVGYITDAPTESRTTSLFAGWRDFYSESEANKIVNGGIGCSYYYEFDKAILPRKLIRLSRNAFGKRRGGKDNKPELFVSSDTDIGYNKDIKQD